MKISIKDLEKLENEVRTSKIPWYDLSKDFKDLTGKSMLEPTYINEAVMSSFARMLFTMVKLSKVTSIKTIQDWNDKNNLNYEFIA